LDDSGDGDSPHEKMLTIGGWLATEDGWAAFEPAWRAILDRFKVPYLHMKEFGDPKSEIYGHLKGKPEEGEFLGALVEVIEEHTLNCPAASVPLDDLRAFNLKFGFKLDPYSVAIYACIVQLRSFVGPQSIDLVFDKFDRALSRAEKGLAYAKHDVLNLYTELFSTSVPGRNESWRDIQPLQAADFLAWEVRKFRYERRGWVIPDDIVNDRLALHIAALNWSDANKIRDRKSFKALRQPFLNSHRHLAMDRHRLKDMLDRHPNGWGA
jgi:hypothetical protein